MSTFEVEVFQNEYLPSGETEVNAIVTVSSAGLAGTGAPPAAAEIVIVDTSGSMDVPRSKIKAARATTAVAIDGIRDGVMFGVIAGNEQARHIYPPGAGLEPASERSRNAARPRLNQSLGLSVTKWIGCKTART